MNISRKKKVDSFKGDVIHIRSSPTDKALIEKAADAVGLTVSSFMLQHSLITARRELAEVEKLSLSKQDAELFFSALTNPPAPNAALESAFKDYDKTIQKVSEL
ncbi:MAG TPA: DUF1778 domain-containing protein [Thermodesulfovibrionia bacterium]|nr:DUF1778 domain-containing protein [Thermodesulfovibrionia bacterium]